MYVACANCGNLNKEGDVTCYSCGQEMVAAPPPPPVTDQPIPEENPWQANLDIRVQPLSPGQGSDPSKARFKDLASRYEAKAIPKTQANAGQGLRSGIPAGLLTGFIMCAFRKSQVDDFTRLVLHHYPKLNKHGSEIMTYTVSYDLLLGIIIGLALGLTNLLCFQLEASRTGAILGALAGGVISFLVGKGYFNLVIGAVEGLLLAWLAYIIETKLFRGGK